MNYFLFPVRTYHNVSQLRCFSFRQTIIRSEINIFKTRATDRSLRIFLSFFLEKQHMHHISNDSLYHISYYLILPHEYSILTTITTSSYPLYLFSKLAQHHEDHFWIIARGFVVSISHFSTFDYDHDDDAIVRSYHERQSIIRR